MARRQRQSGEYGLGRFIGGLIAGKKKSVPEGMSENPERDGGYAVAVKPPSRFMNALSGGNLGHRAYEANLDAVQRYQKEDMSREMFQKKASLDMEQAEDAFEREQKMAELQSQLDLKKAIALKEAEANLEAEPYGLAQMNEGQIFSPHNPATRGKILKGRYGKSLEYGTENAGDISKKVRDEMENEKWKYSLYQQTEPVKQALEMEGSRLKNDEAVRKSRFPVSLGNNVFGQNDGSMMFAVPPRVETNDELVEKQSKSAEGKVIMSMQEVLRKQKQTDPYFKPVSLPSGTSMSPVTEEEIRAIQRRQNPTNWSKYLRP